MEAERHTNRQADRRDWLAGEVPGIENDNVAHPPLTIVMGALAVSKMSPTLGRIANDCRTPGRHYEGDVTCDV
jgi:hypothetical protein